jgi:hypothetical protein
MLKLAKTIEFIFINNINLVHAIYYINVLVIIYDTLK